ncbi:MAG: OmpA family protein, partial [Polynucleobacter sp.]
MNKTLKLLLASVITVSATAAMASDNWQNGDGALNWKNGDGTLCWRDNNWTPATAAKGCDGALVPAAPAA